MQRFYRINDDAEIEIIDLVQVSPGGAFALRISTERGHEFYGFDQGEHKTGFSMYEFIEPTPAQVEIILLHFGCKPFTECKCCDLPQALCPFINFKERL